MNVKEILCNGCGFGSGDCYCGTDWTTATLTRSIYCDFHALAGVNIPATYDAKTDKGWGYVCDYCYTVAGSPALGIGSAQRLIILEGAI